MSDICVNNPEEFYRMPQVYQDLVIRQVKAHTEGEMSGADDYAKLLYNIAPNAYEKKICCERAAEEVDHYMLGAKVLEDLGIDVTYIVHQNLEDRTLYATEAVQDLKTWEDRALFSYLGEGAVVDQLTEMGQSSYRPLAAIFPKILKDEKVHVAHGFRITRDYCRNPDGRNKIQAALEVWWPRALDLFGRSASRRSKEYVEWGLRQNTYDVAREKWSSRTRVKLTELGLEVPPDHIGRKIM